MHGAVHLLECRSISDGGHENFTPFTPWKIFACVRTNGSNTHTLFFFKSLFGTDPIQSIYQSVTLVNIPNNKKQKKQKKGVFFYLTRFLPHDLDLRNHVPSNPSILSIHPRIYPAYVTKEAHICTTANPHTHTLTLTLTHPFMSMHTHTPT